MLAFVGEKALVTRGDRVAAFGEDVEAPAGATRLDCAGAIIAEGRVNAHTHIYSGLAPFGIPAPEPPPESFLQILERLWWKLDRTLDVESLRASARYYVAEALLRGTSTLIDHHESPNFIEGSLDVLADACQELGMRAVVCFGATERNFGREEARRGLAECQRFVRSNARPLVRGLVALHASFTVSDDTIAEAAALCRELGTALHVHLAEDAADVQDARSRGYDGPLERLEKLGALAPGSILAHGVHLTPAQVERVRELGCWLVQNPRSNHGNRVGYPGFLDHTDKVALGTDGYPSDLAEERSVLLELATQHGEDLELVERRARGGYRLVEELFGAPFSPLAPGTVADVGALEFSESSVRARHLCVDGKLVVKDRTLVTAEHSAIVEAAEGQSRRLFAAMRALPV